MQLNQEKMLALFSSILLTTLMVLAVRAGFPPAQVPSSLGLQQTKLSASTPARSSTVDRGRAASADLMLDRAGAGLETGMPYYSFGIRIKSF